MISRQENLVRKFHFCANSEYTIPSVSIPFHRLLFRVECKLDPSSVRSFRMDDNSWNRSTWYTWTRSENSRDVNFVDWLYTSSLVLRCRGIWSVKLLLCQFIWIYSTCEGYEGKINEISPRNQCMYCISNKKSWLYY